MMGDGLWLTERLVVVPLIAIVLFLPGKDIFVTGLAGNRSKGRKPHSGNRLKPLRHRSKDPLRVEENLWQEFTHIIGSDESGTGAIVGPVVTASVALRKPVILDGVDDAKLISASDRNRIYDQVVGNPEHYCWDIQTTWDVGTSSEAQTAQEAAMECFQASIANVAEKLSEVDGNSVSAYSIVDGHKSPKIDSDIVVSSRPYKNGDAMVYTIALASILSRVTRDRHLSEAAEKYPKYELDVNGGYPSKRHNELLHIHGPSPIHRIMSKPVASRKEVLQFLVTASLTGYSLTRPLPSEATYMDKKLGVILPDSGEIESSIPTDWSQIENPVTAAGLNSLDSSDDSVFYAEPRFLVEHVDDQAVALMRTYLKNVVEKLPQEATILDLCSSWTSHLETVHRLPSTVLGLGMNTKELEANKQLTDWTVQDLNVKPTLPYSTASVDAVFIQLSIDYLRKPLEVCREIGRVLKPTGTVHVLFSNRLFLTKAVGLWTGADDIDHAFTVGAYLRFCQPGLFDKIKAVDLSARKGSKINGDPLYVVTAEKAV